MIRIGVIGTGGMANGHAASFQAMRGVKVTCCCDIDEDRAGAFADKHSIGHVYTDFRKMLRDEKIDGITNVTCDSMHAPISIAALKAGINVLCEKPLATSLAEARKMVKAARDSGRINMVHFSKRNSAGLQRAGSMIAAGRIGRVMQVEASYFQGWLVNTNWGDWRKETRLAWRLSTRHGSAGVLGDLGCHIFDLTGLLCGDIVEIGCRLKTFKKGVRGERIGEYVLDANDSFTATMVFANGALGTIASSRWATGHNNREMITVYGDKGALEIDFEKGPDTLRIAAPNTSRKPDWREVKCKAVPNLYTRFIRAIRTGKQDPSDFANGLKVQAYMHACFRSDAARKAVKVRI